MVENSGNNELASTSDNQQTISKHVEMKWWDAIYKVLLDNNNDAMSYSDITDEIASKKYRVSLGAIPAATVASIIARDIRENGEYSTFRRVNPGEYILRSPNQTISSPSTITSNVSQSDDAEDEAEVLENRAIAAFGMFWSRNDVRWKNNPKLLGTQSSAEPVDFCGQVGVYILYDHQRIVYIGRASERKGGKSIGQRLFEHTTDRLNSRWDRFSWFGVYPVDNNGKLIIRDEVKISCEDIAIAFEALLIEACEPPQNWRRGDDLQVVEYQQKLDPDIEQQRKKDVLKEALKNLA